MLRETSLQPHPHRDPGDDRIEQNGVVVVPVVLGNRRENAVLIACPNTEHEHVVDGNVKAKTDAGGQMEVDDFLAVDASGYLIRAAPDVVLSIHVEPWGDTHKEVGLDVVERFDAGHVPVELNRKVQVLKGQRYRGFRPSVG